MGALPEQAVPGDEVAEAAPQPGGPWTRGDDQRPDPRYTVPWEWWDAVLVLFLWLVLQSFLLVPLLLTLEDALGEDTTRLVLILVSLASLVVLTAGYVRVRGGRGSVRRLLGPRLGSWRDVGAGLGHGVAAFLLLNVAFLYVLELIAQRLDRELPVVQEVLQDATRDPSGRLFVVVAGAVLAPVAEEVFYRGMLFQSLRKRLPAWPAIGFSALLFGLAHVELLVIVVTFALALYLARVFDRRGALLAPLVAHATFNACSLVILVVVGE